MSSKRLVAEISVCLAVLLGACGAGTGGASKVLPTAKEVNPSGDIPDNQAFVPFTPAAGGFTVKVPEGWSRRNEGGATVFSDKLNAIRVETMPVADQPTPASVGKSDGPAIQGAGANAKNVAIEEVRRHAGLAVRTTYETDGAPDPVTAKVTRQAVERYQFWRSGRQVTLTLSGPKTADNKDPWRTVTDSFAWVP